MVDHLHSIYWTIKERRRSHAATVDSRRNALRKKERRRQRAASEAAIAGTEPAPESIDQLPSNQQSGEEFTTPTQTEADSPTTMDEAMWEDEGKLYWVLRLRNVVSSLPGGTSVQMDARVKGPQPQTRLLVIIEPRKNSISNGELTSEFPAGYSGGSRQPAQMQSYECGHRVQRQQLRHSADPVCLEAPSPNLYRGRGTDPTCPRETCRVSRASPAEQSG